MNFEPTPYPPGSHEKIDLLRDREDAGLPLWHPLDRLDGEGLVGGMRADRNRQKAFYRVGKAECGVKISAGRKALSE